MASKHILHAHGSFECNGALPSVQGQTRGAEGNLWQEVLPGECHVKVKSSKEACLACPAWQHYQVTGVSIAMQSKCIKIGSPCNS
eukprot:6472569-Amphidinium_carterae.1